MSTSLGTTMRENKNQLPSRVLRSSTPGRSGSSVSIRTRSLRYSQGHGRILKGSSLLWVSECGVFWEVQIRICFWFVSTEKSLAFIWNLLWITTSGTFHPAPGSGHPSSRKVCLFKDEWPRSDCAFPLIKLFSYLRLQESTPMCIYYWATLR